MSRSDRRTKGCLPKGIMAGRNRERKGGYELFDQTGVRHPGGGQPPEPVSKRASQTVWAIRAGYDDTPGSFRAKNTLWNACLRPGREKLHVYLAHLVMSS